MALATCPEEMDGETAVMVLDGGVMLLDGEAQFEAQKGMHKKQGHDQAAQIRMLQPPGAPHKPPVIEVSHVMYGQGPAMHSERVYGRCQLHSMLFFHVHISIFKV